MPSHKLDAKIQAKVDAFVDDLTELIREKAIESVQGVIAETLQSSSSGRSAAKKRSGNGRARVPSRAKGQKRSPEELEQLTESLYEEIAREPGRRIEQIAPELDASTKELALPIKKLLEDGWIKTKGQRRATTYYAKK